MGLGDQTTGLPPGASLVSGTLPPALPPGATLVSGAVPRPKTISDSSSISPPGSQSPTPTNDFLGTVYRYSGLEALSKLPGEIVDSTKPIEDYTQEGRAEHPVLSQMGDLTRGAKELLLGGKSAGKPMGTKYGALDEAAVLSGAEDAAEIAPKVTGKLADMVRSPAVRAAAKEVAEAALDEVPGYRTATRIAKMASPGKITLPSEAFDTSEAERGITPFNGVGKEPPPNPPPSVRRTPGQIAPEKVSSGKTPTVVGPTTGNLPLAEGGGVLQRPVPALTAGTPSDVPKVTTTVNVAPDSFIAKVSDPESHVSSKVVSQYRADIRAGKPIEPLKMEMDSGGNIIGADGRHRALAAKLEGVQNIPVQVTKPAPLPEGATLVTPKKAPSIEKLANQVVDQNIPPQRNVSLKDQLTRGTPGSRVATDVSEKIAPRTVAPEKVPTALPEEVGKQMGSAPLQKGVPLKDQIKNPAASAGESEQARLERLYPDSGNRQMVKVNGEKMYQAVGGDKDVMAQVHALTNTDVREAAINSGINMVAEDGSPISVGNRKAVGNQRGRIDLFDEMLAKGHTPKEIVKMAKPSTFSQMANP